MAPAYSRALPQIRRVFQRIIHVRLIGQVARGPEEAE